MIHDLLLWYLVSGVVVLAGMLLSARHAKKSGCQSPRVLLESLNPDRDKLRCRIINNLVAPMIGGGLVVAIWPIVVLMKIGDMFSKDDEFSSSEEKMFFVPRKDLQEQLSLSEIERREQVVDPMGAVPEIHFGHLNAAWKRFVEALDPDDAIWAFSTRWETRWERKELRVGYVAVRGEAIGAYFLTMRKELDEDEMP